MAVAASAGAGVGALGSLGLCSALAATAGSIGRPVAAPMLHRPIRPNSRSLSDIMRAALPLARSRGTDEERAAAHRHILLETMRRRHPHLDSSAVDGTLHGTYRIQQPASPSAIAKAAAPSTMMMGRLPAHRPVLAPATPQHAQYVLHKRYREMMLSRHAAAQMATAAAGMAAVMPPQPRLQRKLGSEEDDEL